MDWEPLLTVGLTAAGTTAVWAAATASRTSARVSRETDFKGIATDLYEFLWEEGRLDEFTIAVERYPTEWWWQLERLKPFGDVQRYVGIAFQLRPSDKKVRRAILFSRRARSAPSVFDIVRRGLGVDGSLTVTFTPESEHRAYVRAGNVAVYIWPLKDKEFVAGHQQQHGVA